MPGCPTYSGPWHEAIPEAGDKMIQYLDSMTSSERESEALRSGRRMCFVAFNGWRLDWGSQGSHTFSLQIEGSGTDGGSWHVGEAASSGGGMVGTEGSWHTGEAANGGGGMVGTETSWHVGEAASGGGGTPIPEVGDGDAAAGRGSRVGRGGSADTTERARDAAQLLGDPLEMLQDGVG
ncbi:hypothetical protein BGY98DRAFT_937577 [Russula aff. rugulosa BPL654]|nr:hypothetical protein BGY98DRAFT_937577 [Russula aff. rugulosa BPL654]